MHVLIVKLGAIGDVVHALPAAAALKRDLPGARISWAVERSAAEIVRLTPVVDRVVEIDTRRWRRSPLDATTRSALAASLAALREDPVDVALDMQGLVKSGVVALLSRAKRRVGFATPALRERASALFLTEQVEVDDAGHVIEKNLALARHLGASDGAPYQFPIDVPASIDLALAARLPSAPFAILNPGGGWWTKQWSPERFGALARDLAARRGLASLVTFGPGEESLAERVVAASEGAASAFACTITELVSLARRAVVFVGGDTGPMHIAAAAGAPVVGLFGPTSALRNGPFDPRDRAVGRSDIACRTNCHRRTCDRWICMEI
jgi:lipopolysaccharide heptosyltransferase I